MTGVLTRKRGHMIKLPGKVLNPLHVEAAYIAKPVQYAGRYYVEVGDGKSWSRETVAVVVESISGKGRVYWGADADVVWMELYGTSVYDEVSAPHSSKPYP